MSVRPLLECDNTYTRDRSSYTCQKNHTFTLLGSSYCRDHALTIIKVKEFNTSSKSIRLVEAEGQKRTLVPPV